MGPIFSAAHHVDKPGKRGWYATGFLQHPLIPLHYLLCLLVARDCTELGKLELEKLGMPDFKDTRIAPRRWNP
jgi:hypothetical protein